MFQPYSAFLKENNIIEIHVSKSSSPRYIEYFYLYKNTELIAKLVPSNQSESSSNIIYTLNVDNYTFVPGIEYLLFTDMNHKIPLDLSYLATLDEFDFIYRYDGVLGADYSKKTTTFRVFSPFASEICVKIKKDINTPFSSYEYYPMKRNANGVFEVEIDKDLDGYMYLYEAKIFSYIYEVADPYSFALSSNSRFSYIISKEKIKKIASNYKSLSKLSSKFEYIIYECSIRDMTSKLDVKNKCTYEALSNPTGIVTSSGIKTGIDYLSSLNVTHVQLMPVLDFYTVNEDRPYQSYNWGYDPYFFFCNEGSYSTCPDNPYTRLFELKNLIAALHDKNIRVILDVVYNHVFSTDDNPLNILVPKYYFRLNPNGSLSNGSGCGNDFESTHYMARKLIIDSINYYIDYFDVDGFRFDLMGIIDIKTMELAYNEAKKRKDDIFFLGEGWDLWTNLKVSEKCSINNASKLPYICYFNDRFRDVVKGQTSESQLSIKGYLSGDVNYRDGFKHVMLGSCKPLAFAPLFSNPEQSVNYLECHDNHTLFDKLKTCLPYESDDITIKRIKLCIAATMLAVGIPFFHQGEEIGQSKRGNGNSYNSGDEINGFDYQLLDKRKDLYNYFKQCTYLKKLMLSFAKDNNLSFNNSIEIEDISYGGILFKYNYNQSTFFAFFNPTYDSFTYESNYPLKLLFSEKNGLNKLDTSLQNVIINPISFAVYIRGDDKND